MLLCITVAGENDDSACLAHTSRPGPWWSDSFKCRHHSLSFLLNLQTRYTGLLFFYKAGLPSKIMPDLDGLPGRTKESGRQERSKARAGPQLVTLHRSTLLQNVGHDMGAGHASQTAAAPMRQKSPLGSQTKKWNIKNS